MSDFTSVSGKRNAGTILMYGLSTCVWCNKTKKLLDALEVDYSYLYVDLLQGDERTAAKEEIKKINPKESYPTLLINGVSVITGFDEDKIKKELGE